MNEFERLYPLVVESERRGNATLSAVEALYVAYDRVSLDDVVGDDETARAYRVVLRTLAQPPNRDQLCELIRILASEGIVELSTLQEYWIYRVQQDGYV